ncbi:MAG: hypothetical protein ACKOB4_13075 [Acidobacteriota bacterium]
MRDYVYPSVYFAYFYFFLLMVGALFFFFRTRKDGYWGRRSEEAKYRMMEDGEEIPAERGDRNE